MKLIVADFIAQCLLLALACFASQALVLQPTPLEATF